MECDSIILEDGGRTCGRVWAHFTLGGAKISKFQISKRKNRRAAPVKNSAKNDDSSEGDFDKLYRNNDIIFQITITVIGLRGILDVVEFFIPVK